jgi:catechol 2,3-dioxygenase
MIAFPTRRIGHANLYVSELVRTMDFYMNVCGFEQTARETHNNAGFLSNGNTNHDLGVVVRDKPVGLNHFGWELATEADLVGAYKRAQEAGETPRYIDMGSGRSVFATDDDGLLHQFFVSRTRNWRSIFTGGEVELHTNPPWEPLAQPPSTEETFDLGVDIRRVEAAPLHPMRITHSVMVAPNFDRSLRFYTEIAGLKIVRRLDDGAGAYLAGSAARHDLVLLAKRDALAPGLHHIAFEVWPEDDLGAATQALKGLGVPVALELDLPYKRSLFVCDPDGIRLEFYQHRAQPAPSGVRGEALADAA